MNHIKAIEALINSKSFSKNAWFETKELSVYVRVSRRKIEDEAVTTLELASVTVHNKRGTGMFTRFLGDFEVLAEKYNLVIYLENVLEERLNSFLLKRDFILVPFTQPPCYYKIIDGQ